METILKTKDGDLLEGEERRYDTNHDAAMRLSGTILRYEGTPVYVTEFPEDRRFFARPLEGDKYQKEIWLIDSNDKRLDISSIPLGYINFHPECAYPLRSPSRSQRQGVDINRLHYYSPLVKDFRHCSPTESFLLAFGDMVKGKYPTWDECLKKGGAMGKAWALAPQDGNSHLLYHKHSPIGIFNKSKNVIYLSDEYMNPFFLRFVSDVLTKNAKEDVRVRKF